MIELLNYWTKKYDVVLCLGFLLAGMGVGFVVFIVPAYSQNYPDNSTTTNTTPRGGDRRDD